jgi:hypothetical protein
MGYYFKKIENNTAAFFTLTQRETDYVDEVARSNDRSSPEIMIFLTRAQADALAGFFDPQFLRNLLLNESNDPAQSTTVDIY